ncbi:MAG: haloacid dehalogenase type II [Filomicrobium sp.]
MTDPKCYVFDAYGTLFDVHSAAAQHAAVLGERWQALSDIWRTKQLEYTWVRALAGRQVSFWQITEDALDFAAASQGGIEADVRAKLLEAYRHLEAYPEVAEVLAKLRASGSGVGILSNGDPDMLVTAVGSAGLSGAFDAVLSVEQAGIYKPAPAVYELVVAQFGARDKEVSFQSSNRWDIAGASAFGFRTAWINRTSRPDEYAELAPDLVLKDLSGLL